MTPTPEERFDTLYRRWGHARGEGKAAFIVEAMEIVRAAVAEAREEAAKVADEVRDDSNRDSGSPYEIGRANAAVKIGVRIRSLK